MLHTGGDSTTGGKEGKRLLPAIAPRAVCKRYLLIWLPRERGGAEATVAGLETVEKQLVLGKEACGTGGN